MGRKGDQTRAQLINTVIELLKMKGYNGIGLQEILRESGTPKGSLYFHFPGGKKELVETAINQFGQTTENLLKSVFAASSDACSAINVIVLFFITELEKSDYEKGCPLGTTSLDTPYISNTILNSCANCFLSMENLIVAKLKEDGLDDKTSKKYATFFLSSLEGAILMSKAYRNTEALQTVSDCFSELLGHSDES